MANKPANTGGHRAARSSQTRAKDARGAGAADTGARDTGGDTAVSPLAWVPYLIVLAGVAAGLYQAWQGGKYAAQGSVLVGCSLLAAGLARLVLPPRAAGLLSSRRKASDVLAFTVLGAGVLAVALMLP